MVIKLRTPILIALAAVCGLACGVKKETHQKALDELTATQAELESTRRERDALREKSSKLATDLSSTQSQSQAARKAAAQMIEKLGGDAKRFEAELLKLRAQQEKAEARLAAYRQLQQRFAKLVDTGKLSVAFRNGQMVLKLPSGVLFPSGSGKLSKSGEAALEEILAVLMEFKDRRFMIAGHTDNVPIKTRKFANNWQLSTARAVSVVEYMIGAGFSGSNVSAAGFGEFDPVASNDTEEGKQQNRRIEIILVPDLSELPNLTEQP